MIVMKIILPKRQNRFKDGRSVTLRPRHLACLCFILAAGLFSGCTRSRSSAPMIIATADPLPTAQGMQPILPTRDVLIDLGDISDSNDSGEDEVVVAPTIATATPVPAVIRERPTPASYPAGSPTPDPPYYDTDISGILSYTIVPGDTLFLIATRFGLTMEELLAANNMGENDFIIAGTTLGIPVDVTGRTSDWKIIPDSELVYGPTVADFQTGDFLRRFYPQSTLLRYHEEVEGRPLNGAGVVDLVATRFSVNPRLLLAMVEHRTGWVSRDDPLFTSNIFPMDFAKPGQEGLYNQLSIAANLLNFGFYGRAEGGLRTLEFSDQTRLIIDPTLNHGTAGVLVWLAGHTNAIPQRWKFEAGPDGFYTTYENIFGNPFGYAYDQPLLESGLTQPPLTFPWEPSVPWYFTGGPHGGWASGSAWAALDFGPDKEKRGCYVSEEWTVASAAGTVEYSDFGGVLLDLDGDGDMGTGWVLVYWHVDRAGRIAAGTSVAAGERLGHPSCEGGFSNGTHLHFARRFNGYWIAADGAIPFVLDGWTSSGTGNEYDGYLTKDEETKEACVCAEDGNELLAGD